MSSESSSLARLSMSLPAELFRQLDVMVAERGLPSRSQLIAELIRQALAEHESLFHPDEMLAGTITMVYRGERGRMRHQLFRTQSGFLKEVISSQHIFLENDKSLEVLLVQGPYARLKELCDAIRRLRGLQQVELVTTTSLLPQLHNQSGGRTSSSTGANA
ncbi:CopG family ribbon-helix-helix protein [Novosphingobium sp. 1949]|uniref:CopG family ribbon-helix-helix protein n=1 Tax=Novosphingobium organovorum TaxID=2930092 RepID=A0ABT0BD97_9SPHN|nr:CopG family ribbon-helix-helix protein [Novosphingobium organovorum]MCJ2183020.1 CopG family ribbon-helix-helix protein [Novosphingobium organovorum]